MKSSPLNLTFNKISKKSNKNHNPKNLKLNLNSTSYLNTNIKNKTPISSGPPTLNLNQTLKSSINSQNFLEKDQSLFLSPLKSGPSSNLFIKPKLSSPILTSISPLIIQMKEFKINSSQIIERIEDTYDSGFNSPVPLSPWATENYSYFNTTSLPINHSSSILSNIEPEHNSITLSPYNHILSVTTSSNNSNLNLNSPKSN